MILNNKDLFNTKAYLIFYCIFFTIQMDDIKLPLKKGSMNDIEATPSTSNSQGDDDMEVDGSSQV